jgi:hypothetical protein
MARTNGLMRTVCFHRLCSICLYVIHINGSRRSSYVMSLSLTMIILMLNMCSTVNIHRHLMACQDSIVYCIFKKFLLNAYLILCSRTSNCVRDRKNIDGYFLIGACQSKSFSSFLCVCACFV